LSSVIILTRAEDTVKGVRLFFRCYLEDELLLIFLLDVHCGQIGVELRLWLGSIILERCTFEVEEFNLVDKVHKMESKLKSLHFR
jgi:hypothetical protein